MGITENTEPLTSDTNDHRPDPTQTPDINDPGDEVQRNFRYQHGYGAILLIAGACGSRPYRAIWCEHHEDILAERTDNTFEAFQIKTRRPELGDWEIKHEEILKSLKRFIALNDLFGDKIHEFVIVSNTEFFNCGLDVKEERLKKSPRRFLEAVQSVTAINEISAPFLEVLNQTSQLLSCTPDKLFSVLKRTYLRKGPPRESFEAEISHNHLTEIEACKNLPKASLNAIRDEMIQEVYKASSLQVENADRHLYNLDQISNPYLKAKRIPIEKVMECVTEPQDNVFRYQPVDITLSVEKLSQAKGILEQKFLRGNIVDQIQTMKRRMVSTERRLFELNAQSPEKFTDILTQLESVVKAECDEATLEAKSEISGSQNQFYGHIMLRIIFSRLRTLIESRPRLVHNEPYEMLVGITGLLTENCTVWWSERFELIDAA